MTVGGVSIVSILQLFLKQKLWWTTLLWALQCVIFLRSDGVAIIEAERKKRVVIYPELTGIGGRARLVVMAAEVGGRWSQEALSFVSQLARTKFAELGKAFALSLLERRAAVGADGGTLSTSEVVALCSLPCDSAG